MAPITTPARHPNTRGSPNPLWQEPGIGTLIAIEGLVQLGMPASQALVEGTQERGDRSKGLKNFGTIEVGKIADVLVLNADPIVDIHNIRKLSFILRNGMRIDPK